MVDIYKDWNVFVSNMDIVPEQLDGEKLIAMASELSLSREEREMLGKQAANGDKVALESLINSYVPMVVGIMKRYAPRVGYNRDVFMNCIEKVREKIVNTLYIDNFEYNISHYISWMAKDEVTHYIASMKRVPEKSQTEKVKEESQGNSLQEMLEKISAIITDEKRAELIKDLLLACRNERERQLIAFRFGLEDGVPKTLQETADKFGISRERARQIESMAMREIRVHIRRRRSLSDSLND